MTRRAKALVTGAVAAALLVGVAVGAVLQDARSNDDAAPGPASREEVVSAFDAEGITLEPQFTAPTGPVDASYTISGEPLGDETPLVVEVLRTIRVAREREEFLVEKAPEVEQVLTILRTRNVVAVQTGNDEELLESVRAALDRLEG